MEWRIWAVKSWTEMKLLRIPFKSPGRCHFCSPSKYIIIHPQIVCTPAAFVTIKEDPAERQHFEKHTNHTARAPSCRYLKVTSIIEIKRRFKTRDSRLNRKGDPCAPVVSEPSLGFHPATMFLHFMIMDISTQWMDVLCSLSMEVLWYNLNHNL
jgi:hypothetical protein